MILSYLTLLYFISLFFYKYKRTGCINAGLVIILFYILSSTFSIIYLYVFKVDSYVSAGFDNLLPTILYCGLLTVAIMPICDFRSDLITEVYLPSNKINEYEIICWILIVLNFISILSSYDQIITSLSHNLGEIRRDFYEANSEYSVTRASKPLFQYLLSFGSSMSPVLLLFYFYSSIYHREKKVLCIALLISSLSQVILGITLASRNQVIYWIMTAIALYITFRPQMNLKIRRKYRIVGIIVGGLVVLYFVAVTVSRFKNATTQYGGVQTSLIAYIGLPYPQFCRLFNLYKFDGVCLDRTFPIITKYIFMHDFNLYEYRHMVSMKIGMDVGTFFSFLGDAMIDYGRVGMVIYAFILSCLEKIMLKRREMESISLAKLILFLLLIRVPLLGIFAFVYLNISSSFTIIGSLFVVLILNSKYRFVIRKGQKQI